MNWNAVGAYGDTTVSELQEAAGITQFPSANGWYQTINGILVQGGTITIANNATLTVPFHVAFQTQLLGVFTQAIASGLLNYAGVIVAASTDLTQFTVTNTGVTKDFYWLALGV